MLDTKQLSVIRMAYLNNKPIYVYEDLSIGIKKTNSILCMISHCSSIEQMTNAVISTLLFYALDQA